MRVVSFVKPTNLILLSDPLGRACLDDAVGELECQGRRVVADREGVGADNGGGDSGEWWGEKDLCINFKEEALYECASQVLHLSRMLISGQNA